MNTITIQAIRNGEVIDERTAATAAGARKSLLAMIERVCFQSWRGQDDCSMQFAESEAAHWDGRSDFCQTVEAWNRGAGCVFQAQA